MTRVAEFMGRAKGASVSLVTRSANLLMSGHALGIWKCGYSLFYKRELWASKSGSAHCNKSLKISGCKGESQRSAGSCTHCTRANKLPEV